MGVMAVSAAGGVIVMGSAAGTAVAGPAASAGAVVFAGTAASVGGGIALSAGMLIEAAGAAAAAAQWSEIMLSEVTAKPLSTAADVAVALAFCPTSVTSCPTCGLRSTVLVVILKLWLVLSSTKV